MEKPNNLAFNLLDLGIKKAGAVQVYDERSIDEQGAIIPFHLKLKLLADNSR